MAFNPHTSHCIKHARQWKWNQSQEERDQWLQDIEHCKACRNKATSQRTSLADYGPTFEPLKPTDKR